VPKSESDDVASVVGKDFIDIFFNTGFMVSYATIFQLVYIGEIGTKIKLLGK
jgi:hypothetical protein